MANALVSSLVTQTQPMLRQEIKVDLDTASTFSVDLPPGVVTDPDEIMVSMYDYASGADVADLKITFDHTDHQVDILPRLQADTGTSATSPALDQQMRIVLKWDAKSPQNSSSISDSVGPY